MAHESIDRLDRENYATLLDRTTARHPVVGFEILEDAEMARKRFCIFRHDIDMLPDDALPIAQIEADRGVRATYMVLLTSEFYNAFDRANVATLSLIRSLGHDIGLHFDATWHSISSEDSLDTALTREAGILSDLLACPIECFSFHNTTAFTMSCRASHYAGLRNAYAGALQDNVAYVSDSNGMWRFASWRERLEEDPERIQVLTHPEHWQTGRHSPATRIGQILDGRAQLGWHSYSSLLADHGRVNESEIADVMAGLHASGSAIGNSVVRQWLAGRQVGALADLASAIIAECGSLDKAPALANALSQLADGSLPTEDQALAALTEGAGLIMIEP